MSYLFSFMSYANNFLAVIALLIVLSYEIINGFHDSANAIATVIYTRALSSRLAVILSGIFNFLGVAFGGLSVAYTIVHLLSIDLLLNINSSYGLKAIFSMLLAAMLWNLCTWILCLPTSSSHTLVGTIIGVNITYAISNHYSIVSSFNLDKLLSVFLSLIISPVLGLIVAGVLVLILKYCWKFIQNNFFLRHQKKYRKEGTPPFLVKIILILSSIGVSYSHGANDGQKGIGLIMLILICILPSEYFVNLHTSQYTITQTKNAIYHLEDYYIHNKINLKKSIDVMATHSIDKQLLLFKKSPDEKILNIFKNLHKLLNHTLNYKELNVDQRYQLRQSLLYITEFIEVINKYSPIKSDDKYFLNNLKKNLICTIEYAPIWIIILVALSLSIGTIMGWKRIVKTFGEKIGTKDITYVQAISSQLTAAISIGTASYTGVPVSTTHIISSSIAGTILVNGDKIQIRTVKNIIIAWILTFPISIILSSSLYWISLQIIH
ncbi:MAG: inorganic phosphate transporter [Buchnera aphidicola (Schlechtendalia peitan)]